MSFPDLKDELPENWVWTYLKDIGNIASGGTPSTQVQDYYNGEVAWLTPADLTRYNKKFISHGKRNISNLGLNNSSAKLLPEGTVLFSSRAPIGYVVISSNPISTNQGFKNFIPSEVIFNEYVYYYFKYSKEYIESIASGTTFKEVSSRVFANIPIPIPPLPEQHRIVAKIEELFIELDAGVAALKKAKSMLETYRQAVLKAAFEGRLTKEIRQKNDFKSARELINKIKNQKKDQFEIELKLTALKSKPQKIKFPDLILNISLYQIPNSWEWTTIFSISGKLPNAIVDGPFGSNLKNSDYNENGTVPVISITNIDEGYSTEKLRFITQEKYETVKRSSVCPGDILMAKIGSSYGKVGVYPEEMPTGIIPANLLKITVSPLFNKDYLIYYLQSRYFKKHLDYITKSTAQPAFNVSMLRALPIPVPLRQEQDRIVFEINKRLIKAKEIDNQLDEVFIHYQCIKQSILKQAFSGKLVPQNPDDEPAEKLLERIKLEPKII